MILAIADVLSVADVAEVEAGLANAAFVDGKTTAGWSARLVKSNLQASGGPEVERVRALVESRLTEHAVFALATRPKTILGPLFSRYLPGHAYGTHVDDALMGGVRSDVVVHALPVGARELRRRRARHRQHRRRGGFQARGRERDHLSRHHAASRGARHARRAAGGGGVGAQLRPRGRAARAAVRSRDRAPSPVRPRGQDGGGRPPRQVRRQPAAACGARIELVACVRSSLAFDPNPLLRIKRCRRHLVVLC